MKQAEGIIRESQQVALPEDSELSPIVARHFPDRVHAFVWRNWNVVEPLPSWRRYWARPKRTLPRLARVDGPAAGRCHSARNADKRLYLTLLRRNWHLLPYDQLMATVEMSPERLARVLTR